MTLWLDAHLSPRIARWISDTFGFAATAARDLNLRESEDDQIFMKPATKFAIVLVTAQDLCFS
jgi:predicted nuclease of predicted toxin-antitoxin system